MAHDAKLAEAKTSLCMALVQASGTMWSSGPTLSKAGVWLSITGMLVMSKQMSFQLAAWACANCEVFLQAALLPATG